MRDLEQKIINICANAVSVWFNHFQAVEQFDMAGDKLNCRNFATEFDANLERKKESHSEDARTLNAK